MKKKYTIIGLCLVFSLALVGLAAVALWPAEWQESAAAPGGKPRIDIGLFEPGGDADAEVTIAPAVPLPPVLPGSPLSDQPVRPSELTGGVLDLPPAPPSPVTRPEFEVRLDTSKTPSGGRPPAPEAPVAPLAPMPSPLMSFGGLNLVNNGSGYPPDTNGDVGPNYYMQAVNTSIGIFNKQTGALVTAFTFNSFWSGAGTGTACDNANNGDPIVLYDSLSDHWIFMDFAWTNQASGPFYFCFGVSQTGDPTGNYWRYAIRADDAAHPWLPDYPKGGVWPDGLYFSANMFQTSPSVVYKEARAYAFNRAKMEAGQTLLAADMQVVDTSSAYFTFMPSNVRVSTPPAGAPNYFVSEDQVGYFWNVFKFHVDFTNPANTTWTGPTNVSQASYQLATAAVPEPAPGNNLDTLRDRVMFLNQYTNLNNSESLWVQHTVGTASASTPTGIQWAQINVTGGTVNATPVQEQIFNNGADGLNRFMGSMAVDQGGNVALGYSATNASTAPDIRYAGRLVSDPLGQLPRSEVSLLNGVTRNVQFGNCGTGVCTRWGDYSAMTLDPVDKCTFWFTSEYQPAQGLAWATRIGSFKFPTCGNASTTGLVSNQNPSAYGQTLGLTATVSSVIDGAGTPTGQVGFKIGARQPVSVSLSGGVATLVTSTLPAGTYPITATYSGDSNFSPSLSVLAPAQVVNKASTAIQLALTPVAYWQTTASVTATLSTLAPGAGLPTGVFTVTLDGSFVGTVPFSSAGVATYTTGVLSPGTHTLNFAYGGNGNYNGSNNSIEADIPKSTNFLPTLQKK